MRHNFGNDIIQFEAMISKSRTFDFEIWNLTRVFILNYNNNDSDNDKYNHKNFLTKVFKQLSFLKKSLNI